jgi:hypothetical protein
LLAAGRARLERQQVLASKRHKVRELKSQAIIAQVKKLAKEEQFDFYAESDTQKLKLYVKLSAHECMELQIPFSKFQEALPHPHTTILGLRELYAGGIKFKLQALSSYRLHDRKWITPESL